MISPFCRNSGYHESGQGRLVDGYSALLRGISLQKVFQNDEGCAVARMLLLAAILAACSSTALGAGFGFQLLSFGAFDSVAANLSSDGTTVVGFRSAGSGQTGYRWTLAGGLEPIAVPFPIAISSDAKVVIGTHGNLPVRWTQEAGLEYLLLVSLAQGQHTP